MLLDQTISQLAVGPVPADHALEMGHLGYMQWLGALPGTSSYRDEAVRAQMRAQPFLHGHPAVAVFCGLLAQSLDAPGQFLTLQLPTRTRRGGARARRPMVRPALKP